MPKQNPLFVDDATELCRKLERLISTLQQRVEKAAMNGTPLDPALQACVRAVSDLRAKTLEFESALDVLASATKLVKELNYLFPGVKQVIEKARETDDDALRRAVDEFLYQSSLSSEMTRSEVRNLHDDDNNNQLA